VNNSCSVCNSTSTDLIFESLLGKVLTSLCEVQPGTVKVWQCRDCGHLFGEELADTRDYYANDYRILLTHEDEDQIYEMRDGKITYRTDHQLAVLERKLPLRAGMRLLDYGCAKASMPKRLLTAHPDLAVHLFDVSPMYQEHWRKFVTPERWAIDVAPESWHGSFDVVTSFFALEHIPKPQESVRNIRRLLREDGCFYGIVPDTAGNVSDFVVVDHVNHFTETSLFVLLRNAGFTQIDIDRSVHRGALVFVARCTGPASVKPPLELPVARDIAAFWTALTERIRSAERRHAGRPAAIYGSGFYGAYVASLLQQPEQLHCFLDASPYQQGKTLMERPILAPTALPAEVQVMYVGLNPSIARSTVAAMDWLRERNIQLVYLDGEPS